jgi:hypothetical protein
MNYEIELTKERAEFFLQELAKWGVDAKISLQSENWTTIKLLDEIDAEDLVVYAFNMGVSYGRINKED